MDRDRPSIRRSVIAVVLAATALLSPGVAAQQSDRATFVVGTASASRGTTALGALAVPAGSDSAMEIPVAVIHGAKPGRVIAFVAGSHGTEYSTIIAMQKLIPRIDATKLSGTVIIVPALSVGSFLTMTPARNPIDNRGMSGYPGDSTGTQSQRGVAVFTREVLAQADVLVDYHGGDLNEDIGAPFAVVVRGGRAKPDSESTRLAMAYGFEHILFMDRNVDAPNNGSSMWGQVMNHGGTVMIAAAGRSGVVTEADITGLVNGALNVLGALKMIDRPAPPVRNPLWLDFAGPRVPAPQSGVWFPTVPSNVRVTKGQVLGYFTDLLGRKTGELQSPIDGFLVYRQGVPSMRRGVVLAEILPILPELPSWKAPAGRGGGGGGRGGRGG